MIFEDYGGISWIFLGVGYARCLRTKDRDAIWEGSRPAGFFCVSVGAHRAAVQTLSGIEKPGSG